MRTILIICGLIVAVGIGWFALSLRKEKHYGGTFTGAPKVEIAALLAQPADFLGKPVQIEGTVTDQCAVTGCYFYFIADGKRLKVELGDTVSSLPRKNGDRATVEGQIVPFGDTYQFIGTAVEFH